MSASLRGLESTWVRPRAEWCLAVADYYRVPVTVTSTSRTWAQQAELYRNFLAGRSKWPANPPGESAHEYGLAWDSVVDPAVRGWWRYVRELAGFRVPVNDEIHAEVPNWREYV